MYTTPGVYFEQVDRSRPAIGPLRTDIAGFVGYAERGPLFVPIKVTNWRQFLTVFGAPLPFAHLAYAVQGFFTNGGAACYVVRMADRSAQVGTKAAAVALVDTTADQHVPVRLWASHGQLFDPVTADPQVEAGHPIRAESPGAWGNRLAVSLYAAGRGSTTTDAGQLQPEDGSASIVKSLSGFETGAIVRLSQSAPATTAYRRITHINANGRQMTWDTVLAGFDLTSPLRLESVEFTLLILLDGQVIERHEQVSLAPEHSRYIVDVVRANSHLMDVQVFLVPPELLQPECWPAPVERLPFTGGRDGLATVDKADFLAGLAALEKIDEVSLLAVPDVVLQVEQPQPTPSAPVPLTCDDLNPPQGQLRGKVLVSSTSEETPLVGVTVRPLNTAAPQTVSGPDGTFTLTSLPVGLVTLRLEKDGFHSLETTAEARLHPPAEPVPFFLAAVTLPPALSLDDIFDVHTALLQQGARGLYRVALLDPPQQMLGIEEIQTWRARFDSTFGALYYPWLLVAAIGGNGVRPVPPSGHVAGLIARTDLTQGVHRAPANYVLETVKALTDTLDDAQQGLLNTLGINCLRVLPGRGVRVYGARTLSSDAEWRYLNVRRLLLMIEEAIEDANQWAVFEPNNQVLRQTLTYSVHSFLNTLWRRGALAGDTPQAAYQVRCDDTNNPPTVVDAGQMIADIAVAPTIPFEFIRFRLGRTVEAIEVTE
jgi:phage tail sheath protein FI